MSEPETADPTTPDDIPPPVDLPAEAAGLLARFEEAKAARAAWDETAEKLKAELRNVLGQAREGRIDGRTVIRDRPIETTTVDAKALRSQFPEVYDRVARTSVRWTMNTYGPT
jgi:predicted phage-related endonuclease